MNLGIGEVINIASLILAAGVVWAKVHAAEKSILEVKEALREQNRRIVEFWAEKWPKVERLEVSVGALQHEMEDVRIRLTSLETRMVDLLEVHGIKQQRIQ